MRSHENKDLMNLGKFEYQNEHVDSTRLGKPVFAWEKVRKLSTIVTLSTPVRRIVYGPLSDRVTYVSDIVQILPGIAHPCLSLAEPPQGHLWHVFVSDFAQYRSWDTILPKRGGSKKAFDPASHDFGTFGGVEGDLSRAKQVP